jgi:hypothetical protein
MTGAAMSLIKKIDVDKHFAARRAMRLGRMQPLSQLGTAGTKSAAKSNRVPASAETSTLEHSSPSVSSASIPITSDSGRNRLLRPPGSRQQ